mmetsp:Transcript_24750/g.23776  ORF Transcript_24750/g.23776 Transcript_24750/m.23776 type:complete len:224 (+) Transcript_24750:331-1002(+)
MVDELDPLDQLLSIADDARPIAFVFLPLKFPRRWGIRVVPLGGRPVSELRIRDGRSDPVGRKIQTQEGVPLGEFLATEYGIRVVVGRDPVLNQHIEGTRLIRLGVVEFGSTQDGKSRVDEVLLGHIEASTPHFFFFFSLADQYSNCKPKNNHRKEQETFCHIPPTTISSLLLWIIGLRQSRFRCRYRSRYHPSLSLASVDQDLVYGWKLIVFIIPNGIIFDIA